MTWVRLALATVWMGAGTLKLVYRSQVAFVWNGVWSIQYFEAERLVVWVAGAEMVCGALGLVKIARRSNEWACRLYKVTWIGGGCLICLASLVSGIWASSEECGCFGPLQVPWPVRFVIGIAFVTVSAADTGQFGRGRNP